MTVVRGPRSHAGHEPGAQRASAAAGLSIPAKAGKENPDGGYWPGQPSNVGPAWQLQMPCEYSSSGRRMKFSEKGTARGGSGCGRVRKAGELSRQVDHVGRSAQVTGRAAV